MAYSVLLVEDDPLIGQGLELGLRSRGFELTWLDRGEGVQRLLLEQSFNVLVLDLGLPDIDGIELLKQIRKTQIDIPIIVLTARDTVQNRIVGLDHGADDYVSKPASTDELAARVRAVVRRNSVRTDEIFRSGTLELNALSHELLKEGQLVPLTPIEYLIFETLIRTTSVVVSVDALLSKLDNAKHESTPQSIQVHMHSLRKKITPEKITTVRGLGYRLG